MAGYATTRFLKANRAVWALAREHIRGAIVVLAASVCALPLIAEVGGDVKHEAFQLFVYGVAGPIIAYACVFLVFWSRQPAKLDAERKAEIRSLRLAQGLPTDDLDDAPHKAWFGPFSSNTELVLVVAALIAVTLGSFFSVRLLVQYTTRHLTQKLDTLAHILGAPDRKPDELIEAAKSLRKELAAARKLAEQRRHLIEDKGGLLDQLHYKQASAPNKKPPSPRPQGQTKKERTPLKRMLALDPPNITLGSNKVGDITVGYVKGINVLATNVGSDELRMKVKFMHVWIDDQLIITCPDAGWGVISQTQHTAPGCKYDGMGIPIPPSATKITADFEFDYDTIPETGIRSSYRKMSMAVTWNNGKNNPPLLGDAQRVEERER